MPNESAVDAALRVLRHQDRSTTQVRERLEASGYASGELDAALETLVRTGVLDDHRFAALRASSLSERGAGDIRIRHELRRAGVPAEVRAEALELLEPEDERARRIVARRGPGAKTARYLHGKGFSEEAAAAVAYGVGDELG